jgi:uncharacterized membrane protein
LIEFKEDFTRTLGVSPISDKLVIVFYMVIKIMRNESQIVRMLTKANNKVAIEQAQKNKQIDKVTLMEFIVTIILNTIKN